MSIPGGLPRVGGDHPALAHTAGGYDHRLGAEDDELARGAPVPDGAGHRTVGVAQEAEHLDLHEHLDPVRHRFLLQGPDQLQAGPVADVGQSGEPVTSEVALEDEPFLGPVEQGAPVLELTHPVG